MKKILSIDGGGIRGIIPARILVEIEKRTGKPVADLFDFLAGTSTGGILALALSVPDANGRPKYSASDVLKLYQERGHEIFSRSWLRTLLTVDELTGAKYGTEGLDRVLVDTFGDMSLAKALVPTFVTTYDITHRTTSYFLSTDDHEHTLMHDAARATSAAPTYFPPFEMDAENTDGGHTSLTQFVDGGIWANNPSAVAIGELVKEGASLEEVVCVSLGTGNADRPLPRASSGWGLAKWAKPAFDLIMDGSADAAEDTTELLLGDRHFRLQMDIDGSLQAMDDTSPKTLAGLLKVAEDCIAEESATIDRICEMLGAARKAA